MKLSPHTRADYPHHLVIPTRWNDNDIYGHVNNAVYYFYFDTVVNRWLIDAGLLDLAEPARIGLVVDTQCSFFAPASFPEDIHAGLRVGRVGRVGGSSVRYEIGLFAGGETAIAQGHFVHVYVDPDTRRPVPLPDGMREALAGLVASRN